MVFKNIIKSKPFKRAVAICLSGVMLALSIPMSVFAADTISISVKQYAAITSCQNVNYTHASGVFSYGGNYYYCVEPDKNTPSNNTQYTLVGKNAAGFSGMPISVNWMFRCLKEGNELARSSEYSALTEDMKSFAIHAATTAERNSSMLKAHTAVGGNGGNAKYTWFTKEQTAQFIKLAQATFNKAKVSTLTPTDNDAIYVYKTSNNNTQRICVLQRQLPWKEKGAIEVYKCDENGNGLAGAEFVVYDSYYQQKDIMTTNTQGYAKTGLLDFGTYTVVETRFPDNYTDNGTTSWTVTVNSSTVPAKVGGNAGVTNVLKKGGIAIRKVDGNGYALSGVKFGVYTNVNCTNCVAEVTTDANGIATYGVSGNTYSLRNGDTYYFKETATKNGAYIPVDSVYPVTVVHSTVTYANGNNGVVNNVKRGSLEVIKTSEDNMVAGVSFRLTGTSDLGESVNMTAATDASGKAVFENVLIGSNYTIEEINTAERYVVPDVQHTTIQWNARSTVTFRNTLKKWNLHVAKRDAEMSTAQGDATLAGAVYGVYEGGVLKDTYTTDANGAFTTRTYVCGDNWTLREITPSNGYLLDETEYPIGASAGPFTVETNSLEMTVNEKVKMGRIALTKHTEDGFSEDEIPEVGALFEVFLKSAGSYEDAKESERDIITADERGYAVTKALPYGRYTVKQFFSWEGRELKAPFDVDITENDQEYYYIIDNPIFKSSVRIIKKDAESGAVIPVAGAGFKIYKQDGMLIKQSIVYPSPAEIEVFYTNDQGYLIMPQALPYGKYYVVEVQAPEGYVLNSDKVPFEINKEQATVVDGSAFVEVSVYNKPQKGRITIEKRGEMFSGVMTTNTDPMVYTPVFTERALAEAVFIVTAKEDIVTPDGTVHAHAGEIVATLVTTETGMASTDPLYLGKYEVREIETPEGYVLNTTVTEVALEYANQTVEVQTKSLSFTNDRQKVAITFKKEMELDARYDITDTYRDVVFGLYADEDILGVNGAVIPAGALIATAGVSENGEGAFDVDIPFGKYYIREIETNMHYTLNTEKYAFTVEPGDADVALISVSANNGEAIENLLHRGALRIVKTFENPEAPLAGIPFRVTNEALGFDETYYTNENGEIIIEDLIAGNYTVVELSCDNNKKYSLMPATEVVIAQNEQTDLPVYNEYMRGSLKVVKIFEGKITHLSDIPFRITCAELNYDETVKTDENGEIRLDNLIVGEYTVTELSCEAGKKYILAEETKVEVSADRVSELTLHNVYKRGSLKITKTFEDADKPIAGVPFRITNEEYGFNKVYYTDENGTILADGLIVGTYKITEEGCEANSQYILAEPVEIEVTEDEVAAVTLHNKKKEIPKTGVGIAPTICFVGLGASSVGIIFGKRKRRNGR